jgi:hypothetical protein
VVIFCPNVVCGRVTAAPTKRLPRTIQAQVRGICPLLQVIVINYSLAIERILLTLWVGSLWAAGFLVAPTLFALLDDRALAGTIAGNLFTKISYIGLFCGSGLLLLQRLLKRGAGWRLWAIVSMLALVVIIQFGLTPMLAELRVQGLSGSARFGQLHGLTGGLYLLISILGMALVAAGQPDKM